VAQMVAEMLREMPGAKLYFYSMNRTEKMPVIAGVEVGSLDVTPQGGITGKLKTYGARIARLRKLKRTKEIDLTISSLWPVDWINALTGNDRKVAVMQINILNNEQNTAMVKLRPLVTRIYKMFDRIVLGSSNLVPELTGFFRLPPSKLQVIYNPIDLELIDSHVKEPLPYRLEEVFAKHPVLVAAHRLAPIKNTETLFPILKGLPANKSIKLLLIGEGAEKENLEQEAAAAGLKTTQCENKDFDPSADVFFLHFQKNIHNLFARSALFVFPTKGEGLPLGLLEALYSGAIALVSDCPNGGVLEILKPNETWHPGRTQIEEASGSFLMPVPDTQKPETISSWQQQILRVIELDAATRGESIKKGKDRARQFDKEAIRQHWYELF
jgi:glycosyltransferase involved in cell wall biosynthesis